MTLRIGVVAGINNAEMGGGWTIVSTLMAALKDAHSKHEFLFVDALMRPVSSEAAPATRSGTRASVFAARTVLGLLEQSMQAHVEKDTEADAVDNRQSQILIDYLARLRAIVLEQLEKMESLDGKMPLYLEKPPSEGLERVIEEHKLDMIWYMIPNAVPVSVPFIATVWDLEHRKRPYFPEVSVVGWKWGERDANFSNLLPRSTFVLTGTKRGKQEIVDYYRVNPELVKVVPFPTPALTPPPAEGHLEAIKKKHGIAGEFLLYPAQFWAHKNHVNLLLALDVLRRENTLRPSLVLTGSDKGNRAYVHKVIGELQLTDQVFDLGFVSREDLTCLYQGAAALVYPSFFGPDNLPPLEAFASACPVVIADVAGAREQLGDGALYFDPTNPHDIAARMAEVLRSKRCRARLIGAGRKISRQRTPQAYVASICALLDEFEPIRRCWGARQLPVVTREGISFKRGEAGLATLARGWGEPEDWGTWSLHEECVLRFNIGEWARRPIAIAFDCQTFQFRNLHVGCYVEDRLVHKWVFAMPEGAHFTVQEGLEPYHLLIDPEAVSANGDVEITFLIRDAISPAELGLGADTRRLGLGLKRMWLEELDPRSEKADST